MNCIYIFNNFCRELSNPSLVKNTIKTPKNNPNHTIQQSQQAIQKSLIEKAEIHLNSCNKNSSIPSSTIKNVKSISSTKNTKSSKMIDSIKYNFSHISSNNIKPFYENYIPNFHRNFASPTLKTVQNMNNNLNISQNVCVNISQINNLKKGHSKQNSLNLFNKSFNKTFTSVNIQDKSFHSRQNSTNRVQSPKRFCLKSRNPLNLILAPRNTLYSSQKSPINFRSNFVSPIKNKFQVSKLQLQINVLNDKENLISPSPINTKKLCHSKQSSKGILKR